MMPELHKLSRQKHQIFQIAKRVGTGGTWEDYKHICNQCNAAFSKAKAEFLRKQQKNLKSLADGSNAWWRKAKSIARISAPTENLPDLTTADGLTVSDELEKANLLAKYFATQCTGQDQHDDASPAPFLQLFDQPQFNFPEILSTTMYCHLRRLSTAKLTADRLITNRVLRECAPSISSSLAYLFNMSNSTNVFPAEWKHAIVVPIFKQRGLPPDPSNCLPVLLLHPIGKVFDAIQCNISHFCKETISLTSISLAFCLSGLRLKRHEPKLMARMAMLNIVDRLVEKQWMDPGTDLCQSIEAQTTIPNERTRLLLQLSQSSTSECFWDLQTALAETGCVDLALSHDDEQAVMETFTDEELTAAFYLLWQEGRPASVVKVNRQLKELYLRLN